MSDPNTPPQSTPRPSHGSTRGYRVEGLVQVLILLAIGSMAAAASFTHVHNVAVKHGQPGWLAWADAVVLELMSIATGLEIRRRHRAGQSTGFVLAVLISAVALSLAAQVVEAERSVVGWLAAALPALGFLALVKIVLSRAPNPAPASTTSTPVGMESVLTSPGPDHGGSGLVLGSTVGDSNNRGQDNHGDPSSNDQVSGQDESATVLESARVGGQDEPNSYQDDQDSTPAGELNPGLLAQARQAATTHLVEHGRPITRDQLRSVLRVSTDTASVLHRQVRQDDPRPRLLPIPAGAITREVGV